MLYSTRLDHKHNFPDPDWAPHQPKINSGQLQAAPLAGETPRWNASGLPPGVECLVMRTPSNLALAAFSRFWLFLPLG